MNTNKVGKKSSHLNFWANFLLALGTLGLLFSFYLIYQRYNPQNLSFNIDQSDFSNIRNPQSEITEPVAIRIDNVDISLPLIPSRIEKNKWEATARGVSFLESSVYPGEVGNSILYGHNWPNLLGNLTKVKPGDKIRIYYSNNSSRDFLIEYIAKVRPEDTSVLKNSQDRTITLYTCAGFLDSKRLIVVAKLLV